ncbi:MAG TPA: FliM/FliN family flagellar motor switch protein [Ramlibacter sp.]|nr:FliM/FliN family flagellar motor switch protein [Ramlibacter sp.]
MNQKIEPFLSGEAAPVLTRAQAIAFDELTSGAEPGRSLAPSTNPLHDVMVNLQVCVGEARLTIGQLMGAREHQVLQLDRTIHDAVDLLLDGKVVARGDLVAVDGAFAVRITELPVPLQV